MTVLVTGASGQVGSALARLAPPEANIFAVDHSQLDITSEHAIEEAFARIKPTLVINAAAYTAVDKAEQEPEIAQRVNGEGPRLLAKAVRTLAHCRLIHVSTDYVFDGSGSRPYRPDDRPVPLGVYGRSKRAGEVGIIDELGERGLVLRTSWVYAAAGRNFLLTMLRLMRERGEVRVVDDQVGTPTASSSVAAALWGLARRQRAHGIFHWTDAGVASWYDFAVAIADEASRLGLVPSETRVIPIGTLDFPTPARRPAYSVLDKRKTIKALGEGPQHWRQQLRQVLQEIANG